jgi:hypothetical protein
MRTFLPKLPLFLFCSFPSIPFSDRAPHDIHAITVNPCEYVAISRYLYVVLRRNYVVLCRVASA